MKPPNSVIRRYLYTRFKRLLAPKWTAVGAPVSLAWFFLVLWSAQPAAALEAGYAEADITPVLGTPLAGRLERWGRGSEIIHDPLSARCLYLEDGAEKIFLVSADLYAISDGLRKRVLELTQQLAPPERIVLAATHTHSGPGGMERRLVRRVTSGRYSPRVLEETAQQIATCMRDAYGAKRRAAVGNASNAWTPPTDLTGVNVQPALVTVLRVEDSDGSPIAIVVTAPFMPDNVGMDELLSLSADFPGYLRNAIDETLQEGVGALFFNGASGDFVRTDMPETTSWTGIEAFGRAIGSLAVALGDIIDCAEMPIAVRSTTEPLPRSLNGTWLPNKMTLTQCTIGGLTLTFTPFGVSNALLSPTEEPSSTLQVIVGYTNGFAGHVVPESEFAANTEAARLHYFGPLMAQCLLEGIQRLTQGTVESEAADADAKNSVEESRAAETKDGVYFLNSSSNACATHGSALAEIIGASFERRIHEPMALGDLLRPNNMLAHAPWFVDPSPVAMSPLAFELRPAWAALDEQQRQGLQAFADSAGQPLEAMWMLQKEDALIHYAEKAPVAVEPSPPLMFAVHGDKAGAEGLMVGIRVPWPQPEPPLIHRTVTASGMPLALLTPAHLLGAIAGMNGAGVVACAIADSKTGQPRLALPPLAMQLERALEFANTKEQLLEALAGTVALDGVDVFIADTTSESALIVHNGVERTSPDLARGLIADKLAGNVDGGRGAVWQPIVDLLESKERIVSADDLASVVTELGPPKPKDAPVESAVSMIFEPKTQRLRIRFVNEESAPDDYIVVPLKAEAL